MNTGLVTGIEKKNWANISNKYLVYLTVDKTHYFLKLWSIHIKMPFVFCRQTEFLLNIEKCPMSVHSISTQTILVIEHLCHRFHTYSDSKIIRCECTTLTDSIFFLNKHVYYDMMWCRISFRKHSKISTESNNTIGFQRFQRVTYNAIYF